VFSKKLLAVALCFALLLIPIVSVRESSESDPFPAYVDGVWIDGPFPEELYIPPTSAPNMTLIDSAPMAPLVTEGPHIEINILLALDEEYLCYYYHTPNAILDGIFYAELQTQRASYYFEQVFNIRLAVVDVTSWHRDKTDGVQTLDEVIQETGFERGMYRNGHRVEALLAWTYSELPFGLGSAYGLTDILLSACIVRPVVYWVDDNVVQHETSHLCNASDGREDNHPNCFGSNCIMSYGQTYVGTRQEDGGEWQVNSFVRKPLVYNGWCDISYEEIEMGKYLFLGYDNPTCPSGGC